MSNAADCASRQFCEDAHAFEVPEHTIRTFQATEIKPTIYLLEYDPSEFSVADHVVDLP